jgi:hypothetical protein
MLKRIALIGLITFGLSGAQQGLALSSPAIGCLVATGVSAGALLGSGIATGVCGHEPYCPSPVYNDLISQSYTYSCEQCGTDIEGNQACFPSTCTGSVEKCQNSVGDTIDASTHRVACYEPAFWTMIASAAATGASLIAFIIAFKVGG